MFFAPKTDRDAFHPQTVSSPFIRIENIPADLDRLPGTLGGFCWFFLRQIKWPLLALICLYGFGYVIITAMPLFARAVIHVFETATDRALVWDSLKPIVMSFVFWVIIVQSACYHGGRIIWAQTASAFRSMVQRQLHLYIQHHSINFFQNDFAGRLSNKINDTAEGLRSLLRDALFALLFAFTNFFMSLYLARQADIAFLAIFAVFMGVYALILTYFIPVIIKASMRTQHSKTETTGQMVDVITNIYNVKIFARTDHEDKRILGRLNDFTRKGRWTSYGFNKMYMFLEVNNIALWVAVFGLLIHRIENGTSSIADAALLVPVAMAVGQITWWLSDALVVFLETLGNVKDGMQSIVKPFALVDKPNAAAMTATKGAIHMEHVHFDYPGRPVFNGLTLDVPAGQKIGLVGPSGAGKSTLVQLLLRLHDIQSGTITIDGQNIADVTQDSLRNHIAVIPQSSDLLHRSIRDNILYGRLDASEDDMIAAAKKAHAHEFILSLRDHEGGAGYDAMVGERGVKLSGGQRQRVAIARAVLKRAPVLLLDEATSALDSESERLIQASLKDLMEGRTVIAIAHRLSTIAHLDRLIVIDEGRIVEDGTHEELLKAKGLYAHLWSLQSGGFLGDGHH